MKQIKGTDALEALKVRYGIDPNDDGVVEAREQMAIAQLIYDARNEAGLTQKELADLIGSKQSVISRLEDADYEGHSLPMFGKITLTLNKRIDMCFVAENAESTRNGTYFLRLVFCLMVNSSSLSVFRPALTASDHCRSSGLNGI